MSEFWFHERVETGWEIRDENRLLVATIPDAAHEREDDANLIIGAPAMAERHQHTIDLLRVAVGGMESEIDVLRERVRGLVDSFAKHSARMTAVLAERGPDPVSAGWITPHVAELAKAQTKLDDRRKRHAEISFILNAAMEGAS